jgi:hypothetical protein
MFFKYYPGETFETPPPGPVYARVDQIEPLDPDRLVPPLVLLDCIDANWFERQSVEPIWRLTDTDADFRISIIAAPGQCLPAAVWQGGRSVEWIFLELADPDAGPEVEQFHNLFSDPTERGVISAREVTEEEAYKLSRIAGWDGIEPSDPDYIAQALHRIGGFDSIAIYDVGQGAATALLQDGVPVLYFDLGGSAIGNWPSFPVVLQKFCFTANPPVVLSHWDWDHWSSALRDHEALSRDWILPIQNGAGDLGGVHARFIAMLRANGAKLWWWDYDLQRLDLLHLDGQVYRARGPASSRNESGLALRIGCPPVQALLPGDASIANVHAFGQPLDYLVVPHHGGQSELADLPRPLRKTRSHLVYSYGVENSYLHPLNRTARTFREVWKRKVSTALRDRNGLGHVGIDLTGQGASISRSPCSGICNLKVTRWI